MSNTLIPLDCELVLVPNPEAQHELQVIGEEYWRHDGINPTTNKIRWSLNASQIDCASWAGQTYHAAAAGVLASSPTFTCRECGGVLTLSARTTLEDARLGKPVKCRDCNPIINTYAAKVLDPDEHAKREKIAERERERAQRWEKARAAAQAQQKAVADLEAKRREILKSAFPAETEDDGGHTFAHATLTEKIGALATIHAASKKDGLIQSFRFSDCSIAPSLAVSQELFLKAWHADLILVHPSTSSEAFGWDDQDPTKLRGLRLEEARFMVPGKGQLVPRLELFTQELRQELDLDSLLSRDRTELQELLRQLVTEETIRYFGFCLVDLGLPKPSGQHLERLRSHLAKGAETISLGVLYRTAWSAARDALTVRQRYGNPENAAAHGVNKVISYVERILADPDAFGEPYREDSRVPLSEATKIVFGLVLGMHPMNAMPLAVTEALAGAPDAELRRDCDNSIPARSDLLEWLRTSGTWSPQEFRHALEEVAAADYELCAPDCAHDRGPNVASRVKYFYDRLVSGTGERAAAAIAADATDIGNTTDRRGRAGDFVLAEIVHQLGGKVSDE